MSKDKSVKELVLDQTHLTVRDAERKDKCPMQTDLQIFQALTRRALACDLMGVASFKVMERWHRFLMDSMSIAAPPATSPLPLNRPCGQIGLDGSEWLNKFSQSNGSQMESCPWMRRWTH